MRTFLLVIMSAAFLAACSEANQNAAYDGRTYSGKTDTQPWASATFNGDKAAWSHELTQRALTQNEYTRAK